MLRASILMTFGSMPRPSAIYLSTWAGSMVYISRNSRAIGTLPIVSLKKSASMVAARIVRSEGNNSSSRPKRVACLGYRSRTWSDSMHCAWSCSISTGCTSHRPAVSGANNAIAFMQPTSLPSGVIWRNRQSISCMVFISIWVASSCSTRSLISGDSSIGVRSNGMVHWARLSRKSSFQDS